MSGTAIQDLIPDNHCFGCGPANAQGLQLKSYWDGPDSSVATFSPQAHHCAGPKHFVNGGILATLVDCHCICTAVAAAYRADDREIGTAPALHFATGSMELAYRRPTPTGAELRLRASILRAAEARYVLSCQVIADGRITVEATVEAVAVPVEWMHGVRD